MFEGAMWLSPNRQESAPEIFPLEAAARALPSVLETALKGTSWQEGQI